MCVSVARIRSCISSNPPPHRKPCSSDWSSGFGFVGGTGGPSSLPEPAMAPALTQATTHQRQTLTLHPAATATSLSSKLDSLTSSLVDDTEQLKQLVWSSHCCGIGGRVGSGKGRRPKKEIARSEDVSRGEGQATGTALDPPPTKSQALASTTTRQQLNPQSANSRPNSTVGDRTANDGSASTSADSPVARPVTQGPLVHSGDPACRTKKINGKKTMGLQPIAVSGDGMSADLSSPVPTVIKGPSLRSDWPSPSGGHEVPDVTSSVASDPEPDLPLSLLSAPLEAVTDPTDVDDANVDDLLDVISSMESVDHVGHGDVQGVGPEAAAAAAVEGLDCALDKLTAAEQMLLRQAAAVVLEGAVDQTVHLPVNKEAAVEQKLDEVRCKQQQIEHRCQSLLRRAGRLQSRQVSRHVADQVSSFVQYAKDTLGVKQRDGRTGANGSSLYGWAEDGRLPTREEVRNIPTATLVNLVSRLQAPPISFLSNRRYFALGSSRTCSSSTASSSSSCPRSVGARLPSEVAENVEEVAGLWEAQLRYLQRHNDPDATESSSGGESDDDSPLIEQAPAPAATTEPSSEPPAGTSSTSSTTPLGSANSTHLQNQSQASTSGSATSQPPAVKPVSTYQRAAWRWARDRAAVAARWSWLQAQVADLEYRIRQHTDVYRQLRAAKGAVHLGNGLNSASPVKEEAGCDADNGESDSCSASRTRPLTCNGTFRKRRLVKTSMLTNPNGGNRKIPRYSTVRCCCVLSRIYNPCVLCAGRNSFLLPVDPDGMTIKERVGLVDRGFHPVLSLPQDVPLSAHVDSLLKSGDWRTPPAPSQTGSAGAGGGRRATKTEEESGSTSAPKKKTFKRKHSKSTSQGDGTAPESTSGSKLERRRILKRRKRTGASTDGASLQDLDDSGSNFPPSSPACLSSASGDVSATSGRSVRERSMLHDLMRRRISYDIDNIVIPYSMAATTRVERLQYKEILTPKWRAVDEPTDPTPVVESNELGQGSTSDVEDVSEEAYVARHDRSEAEERRKFMSYLKQPGTSRGRSRRVDHILDSRAESSGANTPDQPMSPHDEAPITPVKFGGHADAGGPVKPDKVMDALDVVGDSCSRAEDESMSAVDTSKDEGQSTSFSLSAVKERRRTASLTKKGENVWRFINDDNSAMSWDLDEVRTVAPYEPRTFPLSDSVYEEMLMEMPDEEAETPPEDQPTTKRETRLSESLHPVADRPTSANSSSSATPLTLDRSPSVEDEPDDANDPDFFPDETKKST